MITLGFQKQFISVEESPTSLSDTTGWLKWEDPSRRLGISGHVLVNPFREVERGPNSRGTEEGVKWGYKTISCRGSSKDSFPRKPRHYELMDLFRKDGNVN